MKNFYKVDNKGNVFIGKGIEVPSGFIEFSLLADGGYPKEVQDVLAAERNIFDDNTKISEYKKYLLDTDWYYARKLETGEDVPNEVVIKRLEAREFLRSKGY